MSSQKRERTVARCYNFLMFLILSPRTQTHAHSHHSHSLSRTLPPVLCPLSHSPSLLWTDWFLGHGAVVCWSDLGGWVVGQGGAMDLAVVCGGCRWIWLSWLRMEVCGGGGWMWLVVEDGRFFFSFSALGERERERE